MRLGIDVSTYFEELAHGARYFDIDGKTEIKPLDLFRANGVDIMRIRLWVDPKSDKGEPYLGGNCDFDNFVKLALLAQGKGYSIMLDIHYSDFWVDPGKQTIPKSWKGLNEEQLIAKVYAYTLETLKKAGEAGVKIDYIQVGNEITNGMLWPVGRLKEHPDGSRSNYEPVIKFVKAGCRACREVVPNAEIVLHLERSYDQRTYNEFFTQMENAGVDYDIIGFSYYAYWHGTFSQFFANAEMCKKFKKKLMVVEVGYAFTLEDYIKSESGAHLVVSEDNVSSFSFTQEYPLTPDGQARFVKNFLLLAKKHGIAAVIWWEPIWIPGEGICWASEAGQEYIGEGGKSTRNEWANQCLFDYRGRKLPACDEYKL